MIRKFFGRKNYLKFLNEIYDKNTFEFIPIYGRRRIGKTSLILESVKDREHIYYLALEGTSEENARGFKETANQAIKDKTLLSLQNDWEKIFSYLENKNIILIIDEFPYLISSDKRIPSIFQRIIDLYLSGSQCKLILCGSSISMMLTSVLGMKSALYGRRTGQIKLGHLSFQEALSFLKYKNFEETILGYGIVGGVPLYLDIIGKYKDLYTAIANELLLPNTLLNYEPDIMIKTEFPSSATYLMIIRAISSGKVTMGEIKNAVGLTGDITPYLHNLIDTEYVERRVPITQNPLKSRQGIYLLKDNFLRFYYRFIYPNRSFIESNDVEGLSDIIKNEINNYMGHLFEDIVKQSLRKKFPAYRIGSWWYKGEEIDIIGIDDRNKRMLIGEVKWRNIKIGFDVIERLFSKVELLEGYENYKKNYLIVSKGGFKSNTIKKMDNEKILHWDNKDFQKIVNE